MEDLLKILERESKYRVKQIQKAWFDPNIRSYSDITTLPKALRDKLAVLPWLSIKPKAILKSKIDATEKVLLELSDGLCIESVLMSREDKKKENGTLRRTVCVSSQAGCAMGCSFCATGKQGFRRNLTIEEIIDQYRFWQYHLAKINERVGNMVFMGQGEPLLNYDAVKTAVNIILENTELAQSKITISTVGIESSMEKILTNKDFPPVRIAISLHSAILESRARIVPSSQKNFLEFLVKWSEKYHKLLGSRSHYLSLEYVMLLGENDDEAHLEALINFAKKMGRVKINLIPWNIVPFTTPKQLKSSSEQTIKLWQEKIMDSGLICTIRYSQGTDIAAACGQLTAISCT